MKPIKLVLQAFGPFAGREEIDFTALGNNPLFLINGPTGAGKSSILDAICFALYGQTTGAEREPIQMRCDHSALTVLTEVSLDFSIGQKSYRICRIPWQERAKSRGEGSTIQLPEAKLWELDGSENEKLMVSKSVADANIVIKDLIGLGVEQFRQVMVLPQGKFRELLMASSKEREKIFSQLFETHIYKKIENKLKDKARHIQDAMHTHNSVVRGILQAAEVDSEAQLDEELSALKPELSSAKTNKDAAQEQLKLAQRTVDEAIALNKRIDELSNKQDALISHQANAQSIEVKKSRVNKAAKAQGIYHLYSAQASDTKKLNNIAIQHSTSQATLSKLSSENELTNQKLAQASEAAASLDTLKANAANLQRYQEQVTQVLKEKEQLSIASNKATASKHKLQSKKQELAELKKELGDKEESVNSLRAELEAAANTQQSFKDISANLLERKALENVRAQIKTTLATQLQNEQAKANDTAAFNTATKDAIRAEIDWHSGQAAMLASELNEGDPCPVCGSEEHPLLATQGNEQALTTKQQVDAARKVQDTLSEALQVSTNTLQETNNQLAILKGSESEHIKRLGKYANESIQTLENEASALQTRLNELMLLKQNKDTLEMRIKDIKSIQENSDKDLSLLEAQAQSDSSQLIALQTKVQQIESQVPEKYRQAEVLRKESQALQHTINELTLNLSQAQANAKLSQSALDQGVADEKSLMRQYQAQQKQTLESTALWDTALQASIFENVEAFVSCQLSEPEKNELTLEIENYKTLLSSLNGVISELKKELKDKQKIEVSELEDKRLLQQKAAIEADDIWQRTKARTDSLSQVKTKLSKANLNNEALNKQYTIYGTLNDVASGATGNRISLQRFVLSVLLDDVLIQASYRLQKMSKGRYTLIRKEDKAKAGAASGLELEVEDGNTGKPRSVATLSGGESFMAALSLALGLSDVVQSYAGGIKLDTLFIDEGFGSLDSDALDAAITVLIDLQASGRMIGIISHVTELREQMANRIDVFSSISGSSIKTIST